MSSSVLDKTEYNSSYFPLPSSRPKKWNMILHGTLHPCNTCQLTINAHTPWNYFLLIL